MEQRRKADWAQQRMPAMFAGAVDAVEPFGQLRFSKRIGSVEEGRDDRSVEERWERLEAEVASLKAELVRLRDHWDRWKARREEQEARFARECEHLAQMVLMLKREWEAMRDEHRDH